MLSPWIALFVVRHEWKLAEHCQYHIIDNIYLVTFTVALCSILFLSCCHLHSYPIFNGLLISNTRILFWICHIIWIIKIILHDLGNQNLFSLNIFIGPHWWNSDYLDFLSHQRKRERARPGLSQDNRIKDFQTGKRFQAQWIKM